MVTNLHCLSDTVMNHFLQPRNAGPLPEASGGVGGFPGLEFLPGCHFLLHPFDGSYLFLRGLEEALLPLAARGRCGRDSCPVVSMWKHSCGPRIRRWPRLGRGEPVLSRVFQKPVR